MGVFDTYGTTQIKAGDPWQRHYSIGDNVPIDDGVYFDPWMDGGTGNKAVVIVNGKFVAELNIFDYWGDPYEAPERG